MRQPALTDQEIEALKLAYDLRGKGLHLEAIAILNGLIEINPNVAAIYNHLGATHFALKAFPLAINAYKMAINIQSDYHEAYYNLGLAYMKSGQLDEATNAFSALIALMPTHLGAQFQLGCLLMRREQFQQALNVFSLLLQAYPDHAESQINMAACLLNLGDYPKAKFYYLKALEVTPDDTQILFNLGVIAERYGQMKEAVAYYLKVLSISPDFFAAHNNLGVIFHSMPESDQALMHLRAALRIQPDNIAIRHSIDILTQNQLVTTSPPAYIQSLFDAYADRYEAHLKQTLQYDVPKLMYEMASEVVDPAETRGRVLDLGCGTGLCGEYFRPLASSLVGVDLSAKMLAIARDKQLYDELIESDLLTMLHKDQTQYDWILAGDVLVYLGDLSDLMKAVAKALSSRAFFLFSVESGTEGDFKMTRSGRFSHTKSYIERLAQENGLEVRQSRQVTLRLENGVPILGDLYLLQNLS